MTKEELKKIQALRTKYVHVKQANGKLGSIKLADARELDNLWAYLIESGLVKPNNPNVPNLPDLPNPPQPPDPNQPNSPLKDIEKLVKEIMTKTMQTMLPVGVMTIFVGDIVPNGWLKCDGSLVVKTEYEKLYEIVGDKFKEDTDNDNTKFRLPTMDNAIINSKNI